MPLSQGSQGGPMLPTPRLSNQLNSNPQFDAKARAWKEKLNREKIVIAQNEKKLNDKIIEGKKIAYRHEKVRDQLRMRKEHLDQMEEEGNAIHDADVPMLAKSEQEYQNQITEQSAMLERETSKLLADCIRMSQVRSISSQQFAAWKDQQADEIRKLNESVQKNESLQYDVFTQGEIMREEFVEYWKRAHNKAAAEVALQEEQAVLADRVIQKEESTTDVDGMIAADFVMLELYDRDEKARGFEIQAKQAELDKVKQEREEIIRVKKAIEIKLDFIDKQREEMEQRNERILQEESEIREMRQSMVQLTTQRAEVDAKLDASQAEYDSIKTRLDTLTQQQEAAKEQHVAELAELERLKQARQVELDAFQRTRDALSQQVANVLEEVASVESEMADTVKQMKKEKAERIQQLEQKRQEIIDCKPSTE